MIRLNFSDGTLTYANAGHPSGYLLNQSGEVKSTLESNGLPLGIEFPTPLPARAGIPFEKGDTVFLGTDGIFEAMSPQGDQFGIPRTLECIRTNRDHGAKEIVSCLYRQVRAFTTRATLRDDFTAVVGRFI